CHQDFDWPPTF
nr:immunoglobulin light chain junction region [Macaca mulatta]MOV83571.1 immunoglobulin light chain junction region [Macaca mulatta]